MLIPQGFSVVTPYIFAENTEQHVKFLQSALSGVQIGRSKRPDGRIANCHVRFASSIIMISEASARFPASKAAFYLFVENADTAMETCTLNAERPFRPNVENLSRPEPKNRSNNPTLRATYTPTYPKKVGAVILQN